MEILTDNDKKELKYAVKEEMVEQVMSADITNKRKIELLNQIKEMDYENTIAAFTGNAEITQEQIRDFEGGGSKVLKYGFVTAVTLGNPIAPLLLYLWRKHTDPCVQSCKGNSDPTCEYKCQVMACDKIIGELKKAGSQCGKAKNPDSCKKKIAKQIAKWTKRKMQSQQRLNKARMRA